MLLSENDNTARCWTCNKNVDLNTVKYYTPLNKPPVKVFCDAYCSFDYYKNLDNFKDEDK